MEAVTKDPVEMTPNPVTDVLSSMEQEYLELKVKVDDDTNGFVFSQKVAFDGKSWHCHLCNCRIENLILVPDHIETKRHQQKLSIQQHPRSLFKRLEKVSLKKSGGSSEGSWAGGGDALIQETLDNYKGGALVGLEYLLEIVPRFADQEPRYFCTLCDKKGDPRVILGHLTSFKHQLKYLNAHFWLTYRRVTTQFDEKHEKLELQDAVFNLCVQIEERYGRLKPVPCKAENYDANAEKIKEQVVEGSHFKEVGAGLFPQKGFKKKMNSEKLEDEALFPEDFDTHEDTVRENPWPVQVHDVGPYPSRLNSGYEHTRGIHREVARSSGRHSPIRFIGPFRGREDERTDRRGFPRERSRSPGRRSPRRHSPGRRSPGWRPPGRRSPGWRPHGRRSPGRHSPGRRSPGRRSPGRRSPGRRSPGRRSPPRFHDLPHFGEDDRRGFHRERHRSSENFHGPSRMEDERGDRRGGERERPWGAGRHSPLRHHGSSSQQAEGGRPDRRGHFVREIPHAPTDYERQSFGNRGERNLSRMLETLEERAKEKLLKKGSGVPNPSHVSHGSPWRSRSRSRSPSRLDSRRYDDHRPVVRSRRSRSSSSSRRYAQSRRSNSRSFRISPHRTEKSPPRTVQRSSPLGVRVDDKSSEYLEEERKLEEEILTEIKYYESYPEKHPKYESEWNHFWLKRYTELQGKNRDPMKHDFTKEWTKAWSQRLIELFEEELKSKKEQLSVKRLREPETSKKPEPPKEDKEVIFPGAPSTSNKNGETDKGFDVADKQNVTVNKVLQVLVALETQLGSLGPKVNALLAQSIVLERSVPGSSQRILDDPGNVVIFEMVREKLKGQLLAGTVQGMMVSATQMSINNLTAMLENVQVQIPPPVQQKPPVEMDKVAFSEQIAAFLVTQGKSDLSHEDLQQLINAIAPQQTNKDAGFPKPDNRNEFDMLFNKTKSTPGLSVGQKTNALSFKIMSSEKPQHSVPMGVNNKTNNESDQDSSFRAMFAAVSRKVKEREMALKTAEKTTSQQSAANITAMGVPIPLADSSARLKARIKTGKIPSAPVVNPPVYYNVGTAPFNRRLI